MSGADGAMAKQEERGPLDRGNTKALDSVNQKVAAEESHEQWERCQCEQYNCQSCVAEWLAMVDNAEHHCSAYYVQERVRMIQRMGLTAQSTALRRQLTSCCLKKLSSGTQEDITRMCIVHATGHFRGKLFFYWFHRAISDTTIDGRTQFSYASALAALQFSYIFMKNPSMLTGEEPVPDSLFEQVCSALRWGNARYEKLFGTVAVELGPEETLKACEDMGLRLDFKEDIYSYHKQEMVKYLFYLKQNQILLLYQEKPYKAVSVVCTADPNAVCLFDSQLHRSHSDAEMGAMVFYTLKQVAGMMLQKYEDYTLPFQGRCSVVLLTL